MGYEGNHYNHAGRNATAGRLAAAALAAALAAMLFFAHGAQALTEAEELGRFGEEGSGAGQLFPGPSAADPKTGHLYFADEAGNHRVDEFTPWGEFIMAFGWDVAPGPVNEQQEVRVRAGAGTFRLGFEGSGTSDLPYDASGEEVKTALEALATIGGAGGEVAVRALPGDPSQETPYVYVVTFKGSLAGSDVEQLSAEEGSTPLGQGEPVTELEVRTRAEGTADGTGLEDCTAESGCQKGAEGPTEGTGAGQVSPQTIAVDASGDIYVGETRNTFAPFTDEPETTNARVQKFSPSGRFILMFGGEVDKTTGADVCTAASGDECGAGVRGSGPGEFGDQEIEVSDGPSGEVWVRTVDQRAAHAVSKGVEFNFHERIDGRIERFDAQGVYQSEVNVGGGAARFAVDPQGGNLYVDYYPPAFFSNEFETARTENHVLELDPDSGEEIGSLSAIEPEQLAFDPAGDLFVVQPEGVQGSPRDTQFFAPSDVQEFDPDGNLVATLAVSERLPDLFYVPIQGLSTNAAGDLYVSYVEGRRFEERVSYIRFFGPAPLSFEPAPLRPPLIEAQYVLSAGATEAELRANMNPHFWADTSFHVEYGIAPCEGGGCGSTPQKRLSSKAVSSSLKTPVVFLEGLSPGTTYHYRFVAQSSGGGPVYGPDETFKTHAAAAAASCPENEALRAGASAALPDCRAYEMVTPLDKAGGDVFALAGLGTEIPATLDESALSGEKLAYGSYRSFAGAEGAPFTTQYITVRGSGGWTTHAISPPAERPILAPPGEVQPEFHAFSPDLCEAWLTPLHEPVLAPGAVPGNVNLYRRTDSECGGTSYEALTTVPQHGLAPEPSDSGLLELQGLSADRSEALYVDDGALTEDAPAAEKEGRRSELYVRSGGTLRYVCLLPSGKPSSGRCTAGGPAIKTFLQSTSVDAQHAISADGSRVFWTSEEGANAEAIYMRENPLQPQSALSPGGAAGLGTLSAGSNQVTSLFAAAAKASFTAGSDEVTVLETVAGEFVAGQPVSSSKLPSGTEVLSVSGSTLTLSKEATASSPSASITSAGPEPFVVGQQIQGEGLPPGTMIEAAEPGKLTLSAAATKSKSNVPLSAFGECSEPGKACTIAVSAQAEAQTGSNVSAYWGAAADGSSVIFTNDGNLYEYNVESRETARIAGKVQGLVGMSEDASRIYLASGEVLSGENDEGRSPTAGSQNLYLYEAGRPEGQRFRFIGTLAGADVDALRNEPVSHSVRVAADGEHAAFMSTAPLTGYDNSDAESGNPDDEVFLYDAAAHGGEGQLVCVSCNPSGARPHGGQIKQGGVKLTGEGAAAIPVEGTFLYASRVLSSNGDRLYFESADALVPADTNGAVDVYQWEAPGTGTCATSAASYSAQDGGCVDLISSGKSPHDSEFIDADPSGKNVFFSTLSSLVPADYGLFDIYDARVGGGFAAPAEAAAGCEGEACQGPASAPQSPNLASAALNGHGNVSAAPARKPRRCPKGKRKVKRGGKVRCLKPHPRPPHHQHHHRGHAHGDNAHGKQGSSR